MAVLQKNTSTHNTLSTGHCHRTLYNYSNIWCICFCFNMLWVTVLLSSGNGSDSIDRLLWDTSVSSTPAITSHRASAEAVDDSESLRVLIELWQIGMVAGAPTLSLATKKVFQWILTEGHAQKSKFILFYFLQGEEIPHYPDKWFHYGEAANTCTCHSTLQLYLWFSVQKVFRNWAASGSSLIAHNLPDFPHSPSTYQNRRGKLPPTTVQYACKNINYTCTY